VADLHDIIEATSPDRVGSASPINLKQVYDLRFGPDDRASKEAIWKQLGRFLQRYLKQDGRVVDVACDVGYFIRNVNAHERWATDIRDMSAELPPDVKFVRASGLELARVMPNEYFDTVFFSNYLEHLSSTEAVLEQLRVAHLLLRPGGNVIILQPNIRLIGGAYWDFIDHQTALTDKSLTEAAAMAGFQKDKIIVRFMPYTTKSHFPRHPLLVRAYLKFPAAWWLFGKQTLYIGRKRPLPIPSW
jgi:SAM-dependent methyltransferase